MRVRLLGIVSCFVNYGLDCLPCPHISSLPLFSNKELYDQCCNCRGTTVIFYDSSRPIHCEENCGFNCFTDNGHKECNMHFPELSNNVDWGPVRCDLRSACWHRF